MHTSVHAHTRVHALTCVCTITRTGPTGVEGFWVGGRVSEEWRAFVGTSRLLSPSEHRCHRYYKRSQRCPRRVAHTHLENLSPTLSSPSYRSVRDLSFPTVGVCASVRLCLCVAVYTDHLPAPREFLRVPWARLESRDECLSFTLGRDTWE